ncbi:HPP family protein [Pseudoxanthomonas dokdonensis]|uniref:HPP domain-containing protein n=1 Tax=Pseudoxanthomonas dokdonensis TaxID=344882 RepID=A0A0R0D102_9GAMM|nr:HPP family protein [Pseudoxanthomonas dokdonensis]KRG71684.1 HPP domain-containing protein [Pseudoxanthomonas dokdonensis]
MNTPSSLLHPLRQWLGIERNTTSHGEKWISGIGAMLGILAVYAITHALFPHGFMGSAGGMMMLASMGASAVLLFAVPQGALSQPWAVLGGHLMSAAVGVSCQKLFPGHAWTGALAVGVAVASMHYLRCIHPPGGATALAAVISGADVHALGYQYLLTPVLINVAAILSMAVAFNAFFPWRRYPAHLHKRIASAPPIAPAERVHELTQEDFSAAMEQLNSYVDISSESLVELLELAKQHAERSVMHPREILPGRFYSNGKLGQLWSVRQVGEEAVNAAEGVGYRVLAGDGLGQQSRCSVAEFRGWARFEVQPRGNGRWVKAG